MNVTGSIYLGMGLCALLLAMHLSGVLDLGYFAYGLGLILFGLMISLTVSLSGQKDRADG
ncbi:MAG: hypothetical protein V2I27_07130 [Erythrobacter sp.]|nr:hypothetical protein [Erythrobacter sp.]